MVAIDKTMRLNHYKFETNMRQKRGIYMIKYVYVITAVLMEGRSLWFINSSGLILKMTVFPTMEYLVMLFLILYILKSKVD